VFSAYGTAQHAQPNVPSAVPPTEAQPHFAAYRHDIVHATGSPQHSYHPQPSAAAAGAPAGSNLANMPVVQTFANVAVPAPNLI